MHTPAYLLVHMGERKGEMAKTRRALRSEAGFTIVETLTAVTVLSVALVALLFATGYGVTGLDASRRSTNALFLAERRMEQVNAWSLSKAANQGWANVTAANFPAEGYSTIAGYPEYRRSVTIIDSPAGIANTKQVEVFVFYRPVNTQGLAGETSVVVSTRLTFR